MSDLGEEFAKISFSRKALRPIFFCYVALSRPTVKCEKTGLVFFIYLFFFFFMSDLGEEFAKICIQWLKKALVHAF